MDFDMDICVFQLKFKVVEGQDFNSVFTNGYTNIRTTSILWTVSDRNITLEIILEIILHFK